MFLTLDFVDQAVKEWGIRYIFVQTGVDSDDKKRWEMFLHMHSMMDEFAVSMYADNIRAAQEGLFLNQMVFGTITYGYTGVPIPDQFTRRGLPSRRLTIDEETSQFVVQIFRWYVLDRIPMDEIARRLNDSPHITFQQVTSTITYVKSLDTDAKIKSFDRIFEAQPAVLGAVVQLKSLGVECGMQEHAFHVLLILFECFTRYVPNLPRITEEAVQKALDNNVSILELLDNESPEDAVRLQCFSIERYPEPNVLAYVTGYPNEQGLSRFSRENELVVRTCKAIMDAFVQAKQQSAERKSH